mmetsp:Transcript_11387/g.35105  ORF Transcript_11387/g.35105 Transcript_11387/m.35105 type:complete len:302 (-) Transcript_11387:235-1140(-)
MSAIAAPSFLRFFSRRFMNSSQPGMSRNAFLDNGLPARSKWARDASFRRAEGTPAASRRFRSSVSFRSEGHRAARPLSTQERALSSARSSTSAGHLESPPPSRSAVRPQPATANTFNLASAAKDGPPPGPSGFRDRSRSSNAGAAARHATAPPLAILLSDASSFFRPPLPSAGSAARRFRPSLHAASLGNAPANASGSTSSLFADRSSVRSLEEGPPRTSTTTFGTFSSLCSVRDRTPVFAAASAFFLTTLEPVLLVGGPARPAILAMSLPILDWPQPIDRAPRRAASSYRSPAALWGSSG